MAAIFTPGATTQDIVDWVREHLQPRGALTGRRAITGCAGHPRAGTGRWTGQREQWGDVGRQRFWPNDTRRSLRPIQWRRGRRSRSAASVSLGRAVRTQPRRLEMRWTWVSTQMPGQAEGERHDQVGGLAARRRAA